MSLVELLKGLIRGDTVDPFAIKNLEERNERIRVELEKLEHEHAVLVAGLRKAKGRNK